MSLKRDLSGFAAPAGLPAPPPPPVLAPAVVTPPADDVVPAQTVPDETPDPTPDQAPDPTPDRPGDEGAATPTTRASRGARGASAAGGRGTARKPTGGRPGRKRICVSLTLETSEQLAGLAQARRAWKVEVVLASLARWESPIREGGAATDQTRFRRRRSSTPTPFVMDLTPEELRRLDDLAEAVGSSRSALVRQLILLEAAAADGPET